MTNLEKLIQECEGELDDWEFLYQKECRKLLEIIKVQNHALKGYAEADSDPETSPITQAAKQALEKTEQIAGSE